MPLLDFLFGSKKKEKDLLEELEQQMREQIAEQAEYKSFLKEEPLAFKDIFGSRQLEEPVVCLDAMEGLGGRDLVEEPVAVPQWFGEAAPELPQWFEGRPFQISEEHIELPDWFLGRETIDENYFGLKTLFEGEETGPIEMPDWFEERELATEHTRHIIEIPEFIREEPFPGPPVPDEPPMPQPDKIDNLIQPWMNTLEKTLLQHKTHSIAHLFPGREPEDVGIPDFIHQHHRLEEIDAMPEGTVEEITAKIQALKRFEEELSA